MKGFKLLGLVILLGVFLVPIKVDAYVLQNWWLGGKNKIFRYNQPATKHSLQVAHAYIHWNKQSPGTIQRMDNAANVRLSDVYRVNVTGGTTFSTGKIEFNDYWMIKNNHYGTSKNREEYSFNIVTHEFGYALGLDHGQRSNYMMYRGMNPRNNLPTADDKAGMLASKKKW